MHRILFYLTKSIILYSGRFLSPQEGQHSPFFKFAVSCLPSVLLQGNEVHLKFLHTTFSESDGSVFSSTRI